MHRSSSRNGKTSKDVERDKVVELEKHGYLTGYYVIAMDWIKSWLGYIQGGKRPGRLETSQLFETNGKPKSGLKLAKDYRVFNQKQWEYLYSIYGGDPPIACAAASIYTMTVPAITKAKLEAAKPPKAKRETILVHESKTPKKPELRSSESKTLQKPEKHLSEVTNSNSNSLKGSVSIKSKSPEPSKMIKAQLEEKITKTPVESKSLDPRSVTPIRSKSRTSLIADHLRKSPILEPKQSIEFKSKFVGSDTPASSTVSTHKDRGVIGLENPMFYCYMNTTLQCLLSIIPFCNYLRNITQKPESQLSNTLSDFVKDADHGGILRPADL